MWTEISKETGCVVTHMSKYMKNIYYHFSCLQKEDSSFGPGSKHNTFNVPWCRFLLWCDGNYSWSSWGSQIQQRQSKGSNNLVNVSNFEGVLSTLCHYIFFLSVWNIFQFHLLMQVPGMIFIRKYLVCSLRASTEQCLN